MNFNRPYVAIFFDEKAYWEMGYMIERWIFVGFMIWRVEIVWIYGLKRGKQAKYCELKK